ncbi:MAG: hypothetical protein KBI47_23570 [Armatimonadetes bacterium]|nr:hypothetical protein [Armatimonadota bacterium]
MSGNRLNDDLCPSCGVPVPHSRRGPTCPHCGHPFDEPLEGRAGHLTPFGYGVCGLIAGGQIGAAVALTDPAIRFEDPRLALFPMLGGLACCLVAAWLGSRLDVGVRRGYEVAIFSIIGGTFTVFVLALWGVNRTETLAAWGAGIALACVPFVRRVLFALRTEEGRRT